MRLTACPKPPFLRWGGPLTGHIIEASEHRPALGYLQCVHGAGGPTVGTEQQCQIVDPLGQRRVARAQPIGIGRGEDDRLSCLIDFGIAVPFSRSPMVVFEVIGQLKQRGVRAFMIAAERNRWTSLSPKGGLTLYLADEIVRRMADREERRRAQAQRNSVSFNQSE